MPTLENHTVILGRDYPGHELPPGTKVWSNIMNQWLPRSDAGLKCVICEYWFAIPN